MLALVGTVLAVGSAGAAQTGSYEDVPEGAYYAEAVAALSEAGVFAGTLCVGGFCPENPVDRKTVAAWMVRVLEGGDPPPVPRSRFDDVDATGFHAPFIERMHELEVTRGCGDGRGFCPDRSLTRAEIAVFLSRAFDLTEAQHPGFSDVSADAWYAADVARLASSGITVGCGDGSRFCPDRSVTRAEMATLLYRALNHQEPGTEDTEDTGAGGTRRTGGTGGAGGTGGGTGGAGGTGGGTGGGAGGTRGTGGGTGGTGGHGSGIGGAGGGTGTGGTSAGADSAEYTAVAVQGHQACAIRSTGTVRCWAHGMSATDPPQAEFTAIAAVVGQHCGIRTDGKIQCWPSHPNLPWVTAPQATFKAISAGELHYCGIRADDDTVACWGSAGNVGTGPPEGAFASVDAGGSYNCGIRADAAVTCWGKTVAGRVIGLPAQPVPAGAFKAIAVGVDFACALSTAGTIACWGGNDEGQTDGPSGTFESIDAGHYHGCAVRAGNGAIVCWGWNTFGQTGAPPGQFKAVYLGGEASCGLRADKSVVCWGRFAFDTRRS